MIISYGRYSFPDMSTFYAFLRLKAKDDTLKEGIKYLFSVLNSSDLSDFEKAEKLLVCCRLSPSTQKMSAKQNNHSVSQDSLDRIFSLALSLQSRKDKEEKADRQRNNRFMKMRLKK